MNSKLDGSATYRIGERNGGRLVVVIVVVVVVNVVDDVSGAAGRAGSGGCGRRVLTVAEASAGLVTAAAAADGRIHRTGTLAVGEALVPRTGNGGQLRDGHLAALRVVVAFSAGMGVRTLVHVLQRVDELVQVSVGSTDVAVAATGTGAGTQVLRSVAGRCGCATTLAASVAQTQDPLVLRQSVLHGPCNVTEEKIGKINYTHPQRPTDLHPPERFAFPSKKSLKKFQPFVTF